MELRLNQACWFGLALTALVSSGCAAALTPSLGVMPTVARGMSRDSREWSVGERTTAAVQFGRDWGPVLGLESGTLWTTSRGSWFSPNQSRLSLVGGASWTPLPHRGRVGFDLLGTGGIGRYPIGDRTAGALGFGPRFGLPIRLFGEATELWTAEQPIGITLLLVPTLDASFYVPLGSSVSHTPRTELALGLALRVLAWSTLMP